MIVLNFIIFFAFSIIEYNPSGDGKKLTIDTETEITNGKIKNSGGIEFYTDIFVVNAPSIAKLAFLGCQNLVNIDLCDSISSIGEGAFKNCKSLQAITIPLMTTKILGETFYQCEKIQKIVIHKNVESIDASSCFHGCTNLTIFNISNLNQNFQSDDNMHYLMTKDGITLIAGISGGNVISHKIQILAQYSLYWRGVTSITFEAQSELKTIQKEAFGRIDVQILDLPQNLERIEDELFFQATIDTIIFPDSVTFLAPNFLEGITSLYEIQFNNKTSKVLTNIDGVIYDKEMTKILMVTDTATSITIPVEAESIGYEQVRRNSVLNVNVEKYNPNMSSFEGVLYDKDTKKLLACPGGKLSVIIAPTCTEISSESFARCLVQTIDMNGCNLETIGLKAFNFCSGLTSMVLPPSLTTIENFAFEQCNAWKGTVKLSSNLSTLGKTSFNRCQSIEEIDISKCTKITEIKGYTFQRCGMLTIKLPSTVTQISENAFFGASRLQRIELEATVNLIGSKAFSGCTSLTQCVIKSTTISFLSEYLFESSGLQNFSVPDSVTSIQSSCFQYCFNLSSISFSEGSKLETISPNMIYGCDNLRILEIPSAKLSQIHLDAFSNAVNLQSIIIRNRLQHSEGYWSDEGVLMSNWTIVACPGGRKNHTIDGRISQIASHAFYLCASLESIIFTGDCVLESISDSTFYGCSSLRILQLPPRLRSVDRSAFNGCSGLTTVSLGNNSNVTTLGEFCFFRCLSLREFDFGAESVLVSIRDSTFRDCRHLKLKDDSLPHSLLSIGSNSFEGCSKLALQSIPCNVKEIGESAFKNCINLRSMILPKSLESAEKDSFMGCIMLSNIFYCGELDITSEISLFTNTSVKFVFVPAGYKGEKFGGTIVRRLLDTNCRMPTAEFTINSSMCHLTGALILNFEIKNEI